MQSNVNVIYAYLHNTVKLFTLDTRYSFEAIYLFYFLSTTIMDAASEQATGTAGERKLRKQLQNRLNQRARSKYPTLRKGIRNIDESRIANKRAKNRGQSW